MRGTETVSGGECKEIYLLLNSIELRALLQPPLELGSVDMIFRLSRETFTKII